jgi:hypothetical protein
MDVPCERPRELRGREGYPEGARSPEHCMG